MSKFKNVVTTAIAVAATILTAQFSLAQDCASCSGYGSMQGGAVYGGQYDMVGGGMAGNYGGGYAQGGFVDAAFAGGDCGGGNCGGPAVGDNFFSYPSAGGCGQGGGCGGKCGGRCGASQLKSEMQANWAHMRAVNAKVMARNQAWPKPFACADRQLYFSIWEPMIDTGMQDMCTLCSSHFDRHTGELNNYGESAVAAIMQNMPASRRNIYIENGASEAVSDTRMNSVRGVVQKWYGGTSTPSIAFTNRYPQRHAASRAELINVAYSEGAPAPVITIGDSSGSTSDTGQ